MHTPTGAFGSSSHIALGTDIGYVQLVLTAVPDTGGTQQTCAEL